METRIVKIGFYVYPTDMDDASSFEDLMPYISSKENMYGRILLTMKEYLEKYSKVFDETQIIITGETSAVLPNRTLKGLKRMLSTREIDIAVQSVIINEPNLKIADFSYPFEMLSAAFVIQKPEYKPEVFGILKTFSWQLWIATFSILIAMSIVYYVCFKNKSPLDQVLFHTFAVLLRQSSILKPSSMAENLLVYSWVIGAMTICLAYDSVFLSFLAFPPINPIKDISQLSKAVLNGDYHCIIPPQSAFNYLFKMPSNDNLKIIGADIKNNNLSIQALLRPFILENASKNIALIIDSHTLHVMRVGKKFVSEDRFSEIMGAMMIRKDFCCKKVIETFIHRLVASGLYFKYQNDKSFLLRLPFLLKLSEEDVSKRKLTLTDVAPAFIVLLMGYFVSFFVLIGEILTDPRKKGHYWKKVEKKFENYA